MTVKKKASSEASGIFLPTYEEGKPELPDDWRRKLRSREEMLGYLRTACRYWYSEEWYGSERRKTKA